MNCWAVGCNGKNFGGLGTSGNVILWLKGSLLRDSIVIFLFSCCNGTSTHGQGVDVYVDGSKRMIHSDTKNSGDKEILHEIQQGSHVHGHQQNSCPKQLTTIALYILPMLPNHCRLWSVERGGGV